VVRPRTAQSGALLGGRVSGDDLREFIHARMRARGISSQADLARRSGVDKNTLTNWFQGNTSPRAYEMDKVARELGVGVNDLWVAYGGSVNPQNGDESRMAELVREAYERGYDAGYRAGRGSRNGEGS
jgi:transcriptional regulator with XRE-family HTH domain